MSRVVLEVLWCHGGNHKFHRNQQPGRTPRNCKDYPNCPQSSEAATAPEVKPEAKPEAEVQPPVLRREVGRQVPYGSLVVGRLLPQEWDHIRKILSVQTDDLSHEIFLRLP